MKRTKSHARKITHSLIAITICLLTLFSTMCMPVSAASVSASLRHNELEDSGDWIQCKKGIMSKSGSTTIDEVKYFQEAINYMIDNRGLTGISHLSIDGDYAKLSAAACLAFQKAVNKAIASGKLSISKLSEDSSCGSQTIRAIKHVLNFGNKNTLNPSVPNKTTSEKNWMWPTSYRRISCGFADNVYHTSHWHRGIDIPVSSGSNVYASKSGTVALVVNDKITGTPSRGTYVVIDHGDGYYSEYQHLKSVSVKKGASVKQGDIIAKSGKTDNTSDGGSNHLHFEIMYLGKSGLGESYTSYWNSYSKYVNTNPKNTDKVFCTKGNSYKEFKIGQKQNEGVPTAKLVKTNNTASYGVYCYDNNGINYIFK